MCRSFRCHAGGRFNRWMSIEGADFHKHHVCCRTGRTSAGSNRHCRAGSARNSATSRASRRRYTRRSGYNCRFRDPARSHPSRCH